MSPIPNSETFKDNDVLLTAAPLDLCSELGSEEALITICYYTSQLQLHQIWSISLQKRLSVKQNVASTRMMKTSRMSPLCIWRRDQSAPRLETSICESFSGSGERTARFFGNKTRLVGREELPSKLRGLKAAGWDVTRQKCFTVAGESEPSSCRRTFKITK